MKKMFFMALCLSVSITAAAQGNETLAVNKIDRNNFPQGVEIKGQVKDAFTWTDNTGKHLLVLSELITEHNDPRPDFSGTYDAELFAFHYLVKNGAAVRTWRVYDFEKECTADVKADFLPGAACVTDLDKDGKSEVWLTYLVGCIGDVSPWPMKIIMYEGQQKHAMRGYQRTTVDRDEQGNYIYDGGNYTFDSAFKNAPQSFRNFAVKLWEQYKDEKEWPEDQ